MGTTTNVAKVGLYTSKLVLTGLWALPYLYWRMWRAKHFFKKELKKAGLPEVLVKNLTDSYNRHNREAFSLISFAKRRPELVERIETNNQLFRADLRESQMISVRFTPSSQQMEQDE